MSGRTERKGARRRSEFDLIARYFAPLSQGAPLAFGLLDDAAILRPRAGEDLIITKDAIIEGVHFLPDDPPQSVAQKLLRVNLSDLAAKGAVPQAYLLATAWPNALPERWIAGFAKGLAKDQAAFGLALIGGDTVATPGPMMLSCTMIGRMARGGMVKRSGARPGDRVYVTGTIGDAYLGLLLLRGRIEGLRRSQARMLAARYRVPEPRVAFGKVLPHLASAALDVSDGLVADAGHLATTSDCRITIRLDDVPASPAAHAVFERYPVHRAPSLAGGDDYEILFTARPAKGRAVIEAARACKLRVTEIGRVEEGERVRLLDAGGSEIRLEKHGYTHF
ncbi:MAG: thiamine-phosphate kinase [Alphaproteobacteria bacterium]|nr:thiamine-phosphate kinase [Alphaproteobacteria bacterium]